MADSLLAALEELNEQELRASNYASDAVLVIDNDLRTIAVPSNFIFGVYNDKNVLSVNFEMPRTYDDVDLSGFTIQINYLAPNKVGNVYEVTSPVIGEDKITFEWLLDRGVFLSSGTVEFTVCLREIGQEGAIIREFNTTIAKGTVLAGLEIEDPEDPEAYSLLAHIKQMDERVASQAATVASDYAKTARIADDVEAIAEELADDVVEVKEKYGTPLVAATAAGMTDHTKIYVYTGSETGYTFGNWYYYDGAAWTSGGVYNSAGINTDATLSVSGMPADAKKTGDEISGLKEDLSQIVPGLTDAAKTALLACFAHVEWSVANGQNYYDALEEALNEGTPSLLPEGYTQVNYLESNGTQYITTNILSQIPLEMKAKVAGTESDQAPMIGAIDRSDTNNSRFFMLGLSRCTGVVISDETWCARYGAEQFYDEVDNFNNAIWIKTHNPVTFNTPYIVVSGIKQSSTAGKSTCYIRDGYGEYSKDLNAPSPLGAPICLFVKPTSMTPVHLRLYNIQFYIGNMLIFNGIPAIRDSGQKPGLYDIIGDTFYTNEGTGEFIYG